MTILGLVFVAGCTVVGAGVPHFLGHLVAKNANSHDGTGLALLLMWQGALWGGIFAWAIAWNYVEESERTKIVWISAKAAGHSHGSVAPKPPVAQ